MVSPKFRAYHITVNLLIIEVLFFSGTCLKETYRRELPSSMSPLAATAFPQANTSANVYVPHRCHAKRVVDGDKVRDIELERRSDFFNIIQNASPGETVVVHAAAGFGKSSLLCNIAIQWHKGNHTLQRFKYLYLLTVRKITNHTEVLERIITRDLNLLSEDFEAKVRLSLKFCSGQCLILVDGYDELDDDVKGHTSLNEILARETGRNSLVFLKYAVVVVSTRPNCTDHIIQKARGNVIDLPLTKFTNADVKSYVDQIYAENEDRTNLVYNALYDLPSPGDTLQVPLFLAILCCLCNNELEKSGNLNTLFQLRTASNLLKTFWVFLLEIKHHKASGVPHCNTLWNKERETDNRVKQLAKLCFDSIESGIYIFSQNLLNSEKYRLCLDDLTKLGPIEVTTTGDNAGASFIHASFQEYCAEKSPNRMER